jgi:hypothetical protein
MAVTENAIQNIKYINPKRLVLISTIDVFKFPCDCDENSSVDDDCLHPYGYNRYQLEKWCAESIENYNIIRLPGLFGQNIKKNFIYDLIHILPSILSEEKFIELSGKEGIISSCYIIQSNGFYMLRHLADNERDALLEAFSRLNFSALNFTDSRAVFQFYNLAYLWEHIKFAIEDDVKLFHLAVEPVFANELYKAVRGGVFFNEFAANPPQYNFKTIYTDRLGGRDGYIFDKQQVMREIKAFTEKETPLKIKLTYA